MMETSSLLGKKLKNEIELQNMLVIKVTQNDHVMEDISARIYIRNNPKRSCNEGYISKIYKLITNTGYVRLSCRNKKSRIKGKKEL